MSPFIFHFAIDTFNRNCIVDSLNKESGNSEKYPIKQLNIETKLPTRVDKALAWLADSRNNWKEKCLETKLQLKRQTLTIKRLKDSRGNWKLTNDRLKQELIKSKQKISFLQTPHRSVGITNRRL